MKMMWSMNLAISCCLLAACQPSPPPTTPVVVQKVDTSNERARALLRTWGSHDDKKGLQDQVERVLGANALLFSDEGVWPECEALLEHANKAETSTTFYGLSLVPELYQRAIGMGCDVDVSGLQDRVRSHIEDLAQKNEIELDEGDSDLVAKWVSSQAVRDQKSCVHRTMAQARKEGFDMAKGMSLARGKCARPE